ncbi:uncharacterized protein LOC142322054 isoform X2 [Lycorma delicatula]|uniref:uncharacterized protein LOC142322054 isoform X2 n=1 Tax=Lycorma delicatula TaxID=130591 RepID=UPI003F515993
MNRYCMARRRTAGSTGKEVGSEIFIENPVLSPHSSDLQSTSDTYLFEKRKFTYYDENEFKSDCVTSNPKRMHFTSMNEKDELDANIITGKKYACDLRDLTTYQRIYCEKIINDAIYYAKLGKLTENSCITNLNTTNETIIDNFKMC